MVEVEFYGQLADGRERKIEMKIIQPLTLRQLIFQQGIDEAKIGLVVMDGRECQLEDLILLNSRICLFPPMSGG
jgi:hypothetical protein